MKEHCMADDRVEPRDGNGRPWPQWAELFRGFQVALDPKKLLLAAAGIAVMAFGWWLLAWIFYGSRNEPRWESGRYDNWSDFVVERRKWNVLDQAAGTRPENEVAFTDANDLAQSPEEQRALKARIDADRADILRAVGAGEEYPIDVTARFEVPDGEKTKPVDKAFHYVIRPKSVGEMRILPWFEPRGPNPYRIVTGTANASNQALQAPYDPGQHAGRIGWDVARQVPVLIEPLAKFLRPVVFLLKAGIGFWNWVYFALAMIWMLATWALFGGAITRMAAVQLAHKDKIGMTEALRFTADRYLSFLSAPLLPLAFVLVITILLMIFGWVQMIPAVGEIVVAGLGWPLVLLAGLVMAVILVGLIGWPMMYATISAEGSDSFDALSRSYSYVYQKPWHYLWYAAVALAYGAVLVFFVSLMGSLVVYLGRWGVTQAPMPESRNARYLFIYAPESYQWRELLLDDAKTAGGAKVVNDGGIDPKAYTEYVDNLSIINKIGAFMVAVWLYIVFLLVVGFGYSYFWSAGTIIYLLMRRVVDDTDFDEVYLEEEETEEPFSATAPPAAAPSPVPAGVTMVEAPSLRPSAPPPPAPAVTPPPVSKVENSPPATGDGNAPAETGTT
jgi:hypothetical protein